jgi:hypothetical protein
MAIDPLKTSYHYETDEADYHIILLLTTIYSEKHRIRTTSHQKWFEHIMWESNVIIQHRGDHVVRFVDSGIAWCKLYISLYCYLDCASTAFSYVSFLPYWLECSTVRLFWCQGHDTIHGTCSHHWIYITTGYYTIRSTLAPRRCCVLATAHK